MRRVLFILILLATVAAGFALGQQSPAAARQVVSGFGVAEVQGRPVMVEVFVSVAAGQDAASEVRAAVAEQGARPIDSANYTTSGLVWDEFSDANAGNDFVVQYYNPSREPTTAALTALQNTHSTWNAAPSSFAFQYGGTTTRCPSLLKQCPGPQLLDGFNDAGWYDLGRCVARCTLGVTWYTTSGADEADMTLNTRATWRTNGQNTDIETVLLHENGHVAGLGHSSNSAAVMYAYYQGVRRSLHSDDSNGISALYP